jgi:ABC-2 type transport system permease protein
VRLARLELLQLLRTRSVPLLLGLYVALSVLAVLAGNERVAREHAVLAEREPFLKEQATQLTKKHASDLGLLLYYFAVPTEHVPNAWTPLATGLRDVHPFSQHLRLLSLTPQTYGSELGSPLRQLTGSFDYAFVVTFLLPLLAIALCFDVASRDEALGTVLLLRSQATPRRRVVALRLGLRAALALLASYLAFALAMMLTRLPLDLRALVWLGVLALYVTFWAALCGAVAAFQQGSQWNALTLVGSWMALCIVLPAAANGWLDGARTQGGIALTLRQREVLNAGWDKPKAATMAPFLRRRPEWASTPVPEHEFSWPWYYAIQEVADLTVEAELAAHRAETERAERRTSRIAALLPPLAVQRALTRLAATDLDARLAQEDSIARHHERMKQFFYPALYTHRAVQDVPFADVPRHHFAREPSAPRADELVGLLALALLGAAVSVRLARRFDLA